jgi:hypothetical protein
MSQKNLAVPRFPWPPVFGPIYQRSSEMDAFRDENRNRKHHKPPNTQQLKECLHRRKGRAAVCMNGFSVASFGKGSHRWVCSGFAKELTSPQTVDTTQFSFVWHDVRCYFALAPVMHRQNNPRNLDALYVVGGCMPGGHAVGGHLPSTNAVFCAAFACLLPSEACYTVPTSLTG